MLEITIILVIIKTVTPLLWKTLHLLNCFSLETLPFNEGFGPEPSGGEKNKTNSKAYLQNAM